jgi:hypothetical protein
MSRRIDTGKLLNKDVSGREPLYLGSNGDDYLARLAKYIPAEIIGLYLTTAGVVPRESNGNPKCTALWVVFGINFAFVPLYFYFVTQSDNKKPLWAQIILASAAFPVWVFAIGGPFVCLHWYQPWIASITLAFVTVAIGFYKPPAGS